MKSKLKTVYYCDHCKKKGLVKSKMKRHEKLCNANPANKRPCFNCEYLTKRQTSIYIDQPDYGSDGERRVDLFYCTKHEQFKYTPKNQVKGNRFELGDHFNEPMPKECIEFKPIEIPF